MNHPNKTMPQTKIAVGDVMECATPHALARKIRVTEVNDFYFVADVLEGHDTKEPLKVFRAGWYLYRKVQDAPSQ